MSKFIELHSRSHCCPNGDSRISINVDRIVFFKDAQHRENSFTFIGLAPPPGENDEPWYAIVDESYDTVAKLIGGAA